MFGDRPFFGESIFHAPPAPVQPAPPLPNYSGHYSYGAEHSGHVNSGGSYNGYREVPNQGLQHYDYGQQTG